MAIWSHQRAVTINDLSIYLNQTLHYDIFYLLNGFPVERSAQRQIGRALRPFG